MKFYLAVTDNKWFQYLSEIEPDEGNFWRGIMRGSLYFEINAN